MQLSLRIIRPSAWLAVLIIFLFLLSFMVWAMLGKISITVPAIGIILPENGQVLPVVAMQEGHVTNVYAKEGKRVKKGELLAELINPYIDKDLAYLQKVYDDHETLLMQLKDHTLKKKKLLVDHYDRQEIILKETLKDHQEKMVSLQDLLIKKKALYKKHYLTLNEINQAKEDVLLAKKELAKAQSDLELAPIQFKENNDSLDDKMNLQLAKALESQHNLDKKILEKKNGTKILANSDGFITGSHVSKGDYVASKKTLFT